MRRQATMGLMIGAMVGMSAAVGLHMLLSSHPELADGWLGALLARLATPGARMIGWAVQGASSHELGILGAWLSLQFTLVLGGALIGGLVGFAAESLRRDRSSHGASG